MNAVWYLAGLATLPAAALACPHVAGRWRRAAPRCRALWWRARRSLADILGPDPTAPPPPPYRADEPMRRHIHQADILRHPAGRHYPKGGVSP